MVSDGWARRPRRPAQCRRRGGSGADLVALGLARQPRRLGGDPQRGGSSPTRAPRPAGSVAARSGWAAAEGRQHEQRRVVRLVDARRSPASWRQRYSSEPPTTPGRTTAGSRRSGSSPDPAHLPVGGHRELGRAGPRQPRPPGPARRRPARRARPWPRPARGGCRRRRAGRRARPPHRPPPRWRCRGDVTTGVALRHRLEHRQPEALPQARVGEHRGAGVERPQVVVGDEPERHAPTPPAGTCSPQPAGPARTRFGPASRRWRYRPRPAGPGSCGARSCRRTARTGRSRPYRRRDLAPRRPAWRRLRPRRRGARGAAERGRCPAPRSPRASPSTSTARGRRRAGRGRGSARRHAGHGGWRGRRRAGRPGRGR